MQLQKLLEAVVPGKVSILNNSNIAHDNVVKSAEKPIIIIHPTSTTDVSHILHALHPMLEQDQVSIAVQNAGQPPLADSFNKRHSVTIDLRQLKGISLNREKTMVTIGAAETWTSVQEELRSHDLEVGGGSLSFSSAREEFAPGSFLEYELVLASGDVVRANTTENLEIWAALGAGRNCFGIVTSYSLRTVPVANLLSRVIHYLPESFDQLAEAVVDFIRNETDEQTRVMFCAGFGYENRVITCCWYQARGRENIALLQPFMALPGRMAGQGTVQPVSNSARDFSRSAADGLRTLYATFTIRPYPYLMSYIHQEWTQVSGSLKDVEGFKFSLAFAPTSKAILDISRQESHPAGEPLDDTGPFFTVMLSPSWKLPADDDRIRLGVDRILATSWAMTSEKGRVQGSIFSNRAFYTGNVFQSDGENILAAPEGLSDKYDPNGIFRQTYSGGFRLGRTV